MVVLVLGAVETCTCGNVVVSIASYSDVRRSVIARRSPASRVNNSEVSAAANFAPPAREFSTAVHTLPPVAARHVPDSLGSASRDGVRGRRGRGDFAEGVVPARVKGIRDPEPVPLFGVRLRRAHGAAPRRAERAPASRSCRARSRPRTEQESSRRAATCPGARRRTPTSTAGAPPGARGKSPRFSEGRCSRRGSRSHRE